MKKLSKLLCLVLIGVMLFTLAACNKNNFGELQATPINLAKAQKQERTKLEGDIYVSLDGDDGNSGLSASQPVKSVEKAIELASAIDKEEKVISFASGDYNVQPITLTAAQNGIVFYGEENVRFNGGFELKAEDFVDYSGKIKKLDLAKYGITAEQIGDVKAFGQYNTAAKYDEQGCLYTELFVGDKRMTLARYPNEGENNLLTGKVLDNGDTRDIYNKNGSTTINPDWETMKNPRGGKFSIDGNLSNRIKGWTNKDKIWLFGYFYYDWADSTTPIKEFGENSITTKYASPYGYKEGAQYYFFNVFEELDAEGEWYIDKDDLTLYFIPPKDYEQKSISISLAKDNLITIDGASDITIDGIEFCGSRASAIKGEGNNIAVQNCVIKNVAENGVELEGYNIKVQTNTITATGKGGVILTGGDRKTLKSSGNIASNNLIYDWSQVYKTYQPAVGLHGVGATCTHNEIYDSPHEAIAYTGNNHVIEYNDIHDVVKLSSDAAAIYSGRSWSNYGTIIRYNAIYNIGSENFKPTAIYFDDALSGQSAYGNLLVNIPWCGILIGGGRDITAQNNLMVNCGVPILYDSRAIDGVLKNTWFVHAKEGNTLWKTLEEVDIYSEAWKNAYPTLAKITKDFANKKSADFPANPAGSKVTNNVIVGKSKYIGNISSKAKKYSDISNNSLYKFKNDVFVGGGNYKLKNDIDGFKQLPFDQIGRLYCN